MLSHVKKPAFEAHRHWESRPPTRILFVRHGETAWNVARRIQGWKGTGLNALGLRQARLVAARIKRLDLDIAHVVSSDLKRARQTAQVVARALKLPLHLDTDLRERRFGTWEGKTIDEILSARSLGPNRRVDPFLAFEPKGGESMAVFARRLRRFLQRILREHNGKTVVAVTHGGPVRIAACLAAGIPPSQYFRLGRPGNVSLSLLGHQGGVWWVEEYNDMAHLERSTRTAERRLRGGRL